MWDNPLPGQCDTVGKLKGERFDSERRLTRLHNIIYTGATTVPNRELQCAERT